MSQIGNFKEFDESSDSIEVYIERLEQYFLANGTQNEGKAPILLTLMGSKTYTVLRNLVSPKKVSDLKYSEIIDRMKSHYAPKTLVISERFKFYKRDQLPTESISSYIVELKKLASVCDFGNFLEDALRDRLVCGISNGSIQRKLLSEDSLKFSRACELALTMETAAEQLKCFHSNSGGVGPVNKISGGRQTTNCRLKCTCCGEEGHVWTNCRLKNSACNFCGKKGHLAKICFKRNSSVGYGKNRPSAAVREFSNHPKPPRYNNYKPFKPKYKQVHAVEGTGLSDAHDVAEECESLNLYGLNSVDDNSRSVADKENNPFKVSLCIDGINVPVEIDTGAGYSVMSKPVFNKYFPGYYLGKSALQLRTYMRQPIRILGEAVVQLKLCDQTAQPKPLTLLVIEAKDALPTLIGRDWIKQLKLNLNLVSEANSVNGVSSATFSMSSDYVSKSVSDLKLKYPSVFKPGFGLIKKFQARLVPKQNVTPVFHKARPIPFALKDAVERELRKLEANGIIEAVSHSDWATSIVVVPKANSDSIRICGDFRQVNQCLETEHYPLPNVEDLLAPLVGGKVFSVLDISSAFQQLAVSEESKPWVTINTHLGLFRYTRLPFGISSAPSIYQSIMDQILRGIPGVGCFIDDVIIAAPDVDSCKSRVDLVLTKLEEHGISVNVSKCRFFEPSVQYLGFVIDENGHHPVPDKIDALKKTKPPQSVKELKSYLGVINYYHRFIPNLSTKLEPLYRLLHKGTQWYFGQEQLAIFEDSKTWFERYNVLSHYDPNKQLVLCCDASSVGVGAVISIRDNAGDRPIQFASRTLSSHEKNYAHFEKEALSIIFGLRKYHRYLYGRKFVLQTDNKSLATILQPSKAIPVMSAMRIQRWALLLSSYDYEIEFCNGKDIPHADFLSRSPMPNVCDDVSLDINYLSPVRLTPLSSLDISSETQRDSVLAKVYELTLRGWPSCVETELEPYFNRRQELSIDHGCILWGNRVIIPVKYRKDVLDLMHEEHPGITRMKMLSRSMVWWPGLDKEISDVVKYCSVCQMMQNAIPTVPLTPWSVSSHRWERIHVDFAHKEGKSFLLVTDSYSKWPEVFIMESTNATSTIGKLRSLFASYGLPEKLVSDNGPPFNSIEFKRFCEMNGIEHKLSPPYHPPSNGLVERSVQTFKKALLKSLVDCKYFSKTNISLQHRVDNFLFSYRSTPHSFTGVAPSELFLKCQLRTRLSNVKPNFSKFLKQKKDLEVLRANKRRGNMRSFVPGEKVMVRSVRGEDVKWLPGQIVDKLSHVTYNVTVNGYLRFAHADHLKPYFCELIQQPSVPDDLPIISDPVSSSLLAPRSSPVKSPSKVPPPSEVPSPSQVPSTASSPRSPVRELVTKKAATPRALSTRIRKAPQRLNL